MAAAIQATLETMLLAGVCCSLIGIVAPNLPNIIRALRG